MANNYQWVPYQWNEAPRDRSREPHPEGKLYIKENRFVVPGEG